MLCDKCKGEIEPASNTHTLNFSDEFIHRIIETFVNVKFAGDASFKPFVADKITEFVQQPGHEQFAESFASLLSRPDDFK